MQPPPGQSLGDFLLLRSHQLFYRSVPLSERTQAAAPSFSASPKVLLKGTATECDKAIINDKIWKGLERFCPFLIALTKQCEKRLLSRIHSYENIPPSNSSFQFQKVCSLPRPTLCPRSCAPRLLSTIRCSRIRVCPLSSCCASCSASISTGSVSSKTTQTSQICRPLSIQFSQQSKYRGE